MPFCTSCGKEVAADEKFCEECGAPQKPDLPPSQPPAQPSSPSIQVKSPKFRSVALIAGVAAVLIIIAGAYVVGIPFLKGNKGEQTPGFSMTTVTPALQVTAQLTPLITPLPQTSATVQETVLPVTTVIIREGRYEEDYEQIFSLNKSLSFGQTEVFTHDLTRPPLYIKFNLTPKMQVRQKLVDSGLSSEHMINATYVSPNAWFEVRVLDAGSGAVVDKKGFNKEYSSMARQEFMVRTPGKYRIEMSGSDVSAEIQILIGTP